MVSLESPSFEILMAFGASEKPVKVAGGQGGNYRSGNVILKPAKDDEETNWIAEFYLSVECQPIRLPVPIRSDQGGFVFHGWQAWEWLEGEHRPGQWLEKIELCIRFHQATAHLPRPSYFDRREQNPWVVADKVTWGEMELVHHPHIQPAIEQLRKCLQKVDTKSQLIHGDFGGNILFSDTLPPAIIDLSPYWRPVPFAVGVMIADAIVWEGADFSLMEAGKRFQDFEQHLVRAELRRVIELDTLHRMYGWHMLEEVNAHLPLIDYISEWCKNPRLA